MKKAEYINPATVQLLFRATGRPWIKQQLNGRRVNSSSPNRHRLCVTTVPPVGHPTFAYQPLH
jgi:hypothetical protein